MNLDARKMKAAAVVVAAGRGTRAGGDVPKQWQPLAGATSVSFAIAAFRRHPRIARVVLVVHPDDIAAGRVPEIDELTCVTGGATRSASVNAGLRALTDDITHVLIHDAARPCVSRAVVDGVLRALETDVAAAPALAVVDALWSGADGAVTGVVNRRGLFRAQTPQGFALPVILAAHAAFPDGGDDDVALARRAGHRVAISPGCEDNMKITIPGDITRAERILGMQHGHQTG